MGTSEPRDWLRATEAAERFKVQRWPFLLAYVDQAALNRNQIRRAFASIMQTIGIRGDDTTESGENCGVPIGPPDKEGMIRVVPACTDWRRITAEEASCHAILLGHGEEPPAGLQPGVLVIRLSNYKTEPGKFVELDGSRSERMAMVAKLEGRPDIKARETLDDIIDNDYRFRRETFARARHLMGNRQNLSWVIVRALHVFVYTRLRSSLPSLWVKVGEGEVKKWRSMKMRLK